MQKITFQDVLKRTPRKIQKRAAKIKILKYKKSIDKTAKTKFKDENGKPSQTANLRFDIRFSDMSSDGSKRIHKGIIIVDGELSEIIKYPAKNGLFQSFIKQIQCDCESFVYTFEVANAKKKISKIVFSNGERPKITNPRMIPGCCKHLYGFINWLGRVKNL